MTFEESLKKLEEIVAKLESGETSLDESIALYEEAVMLSSECNKALDNAKIKIKKLDELEKAD
ncbi:MAG: exodeoxyribonuclease VII small subunit [Ruminococcaceae bacterium]|nr:exodeoxyribonuclease VII small subunit [Oscillospiraceae bacterium]